MFQTFSVTSVKDSYTEDDSKLDLIITNKARASTGYSGGMSLSSLSLPTSFFPPSPFFP